MNTDNDPLLAELVAIAERFAPRYDFEVRNLPDVRSRRVCHERPGVRVVGALRWVSNPLALAGAEFLHASVALVRIPTPSTRPPRSRN